jgi:bacteriocin-like protein
MTDKKKTEELNEQELDQVVGGAGVRVTSTATRAGRFTRSDLTKTSSVILSSESHEPAIVKR